LKTEFHSKRLLGLFYRAGKIIFRFSNFHFFILSLLISLITEPIFAQVYPVKHYTINDGLPSNTIRAIYKDSRGIMWIGTDAGLCRFDGLSFKVYNSRDGLASDKAWSICEDENHDLWIACFGGGISKFDGTKFTSWTTKDGLVNSMVRTIRYFPRFKIFLIGTNRGLSVFNKEQFINYNPKFPDIESPSNTFEPMDFIEHNSYIDVFSFFGDIVKFIPITKQFVLQAKTYHYHLNYKHPDGPSKVFISSKSDTLIGASREGFFLYSDNKPPVLFNEIGQIFGFAEDKQKRIWIAAWNDESIIYFHRQGGLFLFQKGKVVNLNKKFGLETKLGWTVFFESEANQIWYGTENAGIYVIDEDKFSYNDSKEFGGDKFLDIDLNCPNNYLQVLSRSLTFSFTGGIPRRILSADSLFKLYQKKWLEHLLNPEYEEFKRRNRLSDFKNITDFLFKHSKLPHNLEEDQEIRRITTSLNTSNLFFYKLFSDQLGNTWVASNLGLINTTNLKLIYDLGGDGVYSFGPYNALYKMYYDFFYKCYGLPDTISKFKLIRLSETKSYVDKGQIYAIRDKLFFFNELCGLCMINHDSIYQISKNQSQFKRTFSSLSFDSQERIILGTQAGSILITSMIGDSLHIERELNIPLELHGSSIAWLCCDSLDYVYAGTNKGMIMFSLKEAKESNISFRLFDKEEGFDDYSGFKAVLDYNGYIWVLSSDKLFRLNTKLLREKYLKPSKLRLRNIEVNYLPFNWNAHSAYDSWFDVPKPGFSLPYEQRNLSFYFTSLNYANPLKDRFRYKLDGYDADWSSFSAERKAVFSNIPPGKYTLKVQLMNLNNPDVITTLVYPFAILRPWYMMWWFYLALAILMIGSISLFVMNRIKKVRSAEKIKTQIAQQMAELEMRALQSQMNPHFTFNALNAIQCYILIQDTDHALSYLDDFSVLIRRTLENVSKKFIPLSEEIDYINRYLNLEYARFNEKFEKRIIISPMIDVNQVMIPPMILQPYAENAIIHGLNHLSSGGILDISFDIVNACLYCKVEDNGVGRKKSSEINGERMKKHHSRGTTITAERVHLLNEPKSEKYKVIITDMVNDQGIGIGTRVEITLPLKTSRDGITA
jgi:Histidine kinase/Y_Y_Y domain/Two component regulator propeller